MTDSRKLADLHCLLEVSRQLGASSNLDELLRIIEQATLRVLDCERISIFLYDRQSAELYSRLATEQEGLRIPAASGIAGEAFHSGIVVNVADAYSDPRFNREIDQRTGYHTRSVLTCPLLGVDQQ